MDDRQSRSLLRVHGLDVGLALGLVGLGLLFAGALRIALLVLTFFLGDVVGGLHLFFLDLASVGVARLVLLLEFRLGDVLLALGFLLADVLGVVLQSVALRLVHL